MTGKFLFLFVFALYSGSRIIRMGPNLNLPVPGEEVSPEHLPNSRPVEAQQ